MRNLKKVLSLALAMVMLLGMMVVGASAADATEYPDYGDVSANKQEAVQVITALSVMDGTEKGMEPQATLNRAMAATIIARTLLGRTVADALSSNTCIFTDVPDWAKGAVQYCADMGIVYGIGNNLFGSLNPVKGTEFAAMLLRAVDPDGDYSGESWASKVIVAANKNGLSANIPVTATELTREGAAQMAFNTITEYSPSGAKGYTVDGINNVFDSWIEAFVAAGGDPALVHAAKNDTLAKTVFGLTEAGDVDKFGTPVKNWKYEDEVIASVPQNTAVKTYTEEKTDLSKDLDGYSFSKAASVVNAEKWVDGAKTIFSDGDVADTIEALTGNGVRVDIYATNKVISKVVVIRELLGTVSRVNEASGDTKRSVTVSGMKFETEAFEKGDKVIYTVAGNAIQSMQLAEVVEGTSVSSSRADRVNTGAGTFYFHDGFTAPEWNFDATYDLYLDSYGYIINSELVEGEAATTQYALVTRLAKNGFDTIAMLVLPDGSTTRATLASGSWMGNGVDVYKEITSADDPVLVSFTEDDGEYKLDNAVTSLVNVAAGETIVETGKATVSNITGVKTANNSTLFFVKTDTNKYSVYQGIRNVPTLKTTDDGSGTKASALHGEKSTVALAVYVDASDADDVSNSGASTSASIFVLGNDSGVIRDSVKGNHYTYVALVDGEIVDEFDVKTESRVTAPTLYTTVSYDKNNVATLSNSRVSVTGTVEPKGDVVEIGGKGYTYDDDTLVFYIENNDLTPSSVNAIETDTNDEAWVVANSNDKASVIIISAVKGGNNIQDEITENKELGKGEDLTVGGDVSNDVKAGEGSVVTIGGDLTGTVTAAKDSTVTVGSIGGSGKVEVPADATNVTIDLGAEGQDTVGGEVVVKAPTADNNTSATIKGDTSNVTVKVEGGEVTLEKAPTADSNITVSGGKVIMQEAPTTDNSIKATGTCAIEIAADVATDVIDTLVDTTSLTTGTVTITINGDIVKTITAAAKAARTGEPAPLTIGEKVKVIVTGDVKTGAAISVEAGGELTVQGSLDGVVTAKFSSNDSFAKVTLEKGQTVPVNVTNGTTTWDDGTAAAQAALKILTNGGMFMVKSDEGGHDEYWLTGSDIYGFIYDRGATNVNTRLTIKDSTGKVVYQTTAGTARSGKGGNWMTVDNLTGLVNALNYYAKTDKNKNEENTAKLAADQVIYKEDVGGICFNGDKLADDKYTWTVTKVTLGEEVIKTLSETDKANYNLADGNSGTYKEVTVTAGDQIASGSFTIASTQA